MFSHQQANLIDVRWCISPGLPPGHSDTGASNGAGFDSTWG